MDALWASDTELEALEGAKDTEWWGWLTHWYFHVACERGELPRVQALARTVSAFEACPGRQDAASTPADRLGLNSVLPAPPKLPCSPEHRVKFYGVTAFMAAVKCHQVEVVRHLASLAPAGLDVACLDLERDTPLHHACRDAQADMVAILLAPELIEGGYVDVNAMNVRGETPFLLAAGCGHAHIMQLLATPRLIEAGLNINLPQERLFSPATLAAFFPSALAALEWLVSPQAQSLGADLCAVDDNGRLPLHWACHSGNVAAVRLLMQPGCPAMEKAGRSDNAGKAPIDIAIEAGHVAAVEALCTSPAAVAYSLGRRPAWRLLSSAVLATVPGSVGVLRALLNNPVFKWESSVIASHAGLCRTLAIMEHETRTCGEVQHRAEKVQALVSAAQLPAARLWALMMLEEANAGVAASQAAGLVDAVLLGRPALRARAGADAGAGAGAGVGAGAGSGAAALTTDAARERPASDALGVLAGMPQRVACMMVGLA